MSTKAGADPFLVTFVLVFVLVYYAISFARWLVYPRGRAVFHPSQSSGPLSPCAITYSNWNEMPECDRHRVFALRRAAHYVQPGNEMLSQPNPHRPRRVF